jgi:ribonuclease HI
MAIKIYTDGGCSGNPGPGGWAYIILQDTFQGPQVLKEKSGAEQDTTNNRMEMSAVISALEALVKLTRKGDIGRKLTVYTDSQYVQKGMTEWLAAWKKNGWRTSEKKPVKNQDLWQRLDSLSADFSINWKWVKGHAGNKYNERCDKMTGEAIASLP